MQRFDRDQIREKDRSADHRKQDESIILRHNRRRIQYALHCSLMCPASSFSAYRRENFHEGQPLFLVRNCRT
jgi:hypothetical protein